MPLPLRSALLRAVRAGLELIAAVGAREAPVPLQTRVSIANGLVVVGDLIGSGDAQEGGVVGETPNLESSLVIWFQLEDLGAEELKGIAGPVHTFAALRERSVESCFEALDATGLASLSARTLIGRLPAARPGPRKILPGPQPAFAMPAGTTLATALSRPSPQGGG